MIKSFFACLFKKIREHFRTAKKPINCCLRDLYSKDFAWVAAITATLTAAAIFFAFFALTCELLHHSVRCRQFCGLLVEQVYVVFVCPKSLVNLVGTVVELIGLIHGRLSCIHCLTFGDQWHMRRTERTYHFLVFTCKGICAVSSLLEHLLLLLIWVILICGSSYLSPVTLVKKSSITIECFELHLCLRL